MYMHKAKAPRVCYVAVGIIVAMFAVGSDMMLTGLSFKELLPISAIACGIARSPKRQSRKQ